MERQTVLMGIAIMVLLGLVGFYAGFMVDEGLGPSVNYSDKMVKDMNVTLNDENDIATVEFDNRSLNLMHENTRSAKYYIDLDRDGSSDKRLKNIMHDGKIHHATELVTLKDKTYRLYFRYKDSSDERGDAQLWLYRVEEL